MAWMAVDGFVFLRSLHKRIIGSGVLVCLFVVFLWQFLLSGIQTGDAMENNQARDEGFRVLLERTHDGKRPWTGLAFFPLKQSRIAHNQTAYVKRLLDLKDEGKTVYWLEWDFFGILNSIFSRDAVQIKNVEKAGARQKVYYLANGALVRVIEIRFDGSNQKLQDDFNDFYDKGYVHAFTINRPEVLKEIIIQRKNSIRKIEKFGYESLIVIRN